jgi:formate-dependent nitrite reductase membrane component NrfD
VNTTIYEKSVDPVQSDGRDIDPQIANLAGEAADQKVAGISDPHLEKAAQTWEEIPTAREQDPTYYDCPVLKPPVWSWEIPLYYFTGGAAGACLALGAAAQLDSSGRLNRLIRRSHWAGIIGSSISAALLIDDLGRPSRFLHMLRVFRPTSPMNVGTWILSGAAPTAITAGLLLRRRGFLRWVGEGFGFASGLFGMGLATYTGVLVGNTAIPLWQSSRRILPLLFGASAVASAGSILELLSGSPRERRITRTFGNIGRAAEIAAAVAMERRVASVPQVARPLHQGASGFLWKASTFLTASSLLVSLLPRTSRKKRVIAGALGTAGSLALRYAVHCAGVASARDPRATFHSQRALPAYNSI